MSDRLTTISPRPGTGVTKARGLSTHGRASRAEMIHKYREHYTRIAAEAAEALALTDEELIVHTHLGMWAAKGMTEVTE